MKPVLLMAGLIALFLGACENSEEVPSSATVNPFIGHWRLKRLNNDPRDGIEWFYSFRESTYTEGTVAYRPPPGTYRFHVSPPPQKVELHTDYGGPLTAFATYRFIRSDSLIIKWSNLNITRPDGSPRYSWTFEPEEGWQVITLLRVDRAPLY
jgi:hypothetical protein